MAVAIAIELDCIWVINVCFVYAKRYISFNACRRHRVLWRCFARHPSLFALGACRCFIRLLYRVFRARSMRVDATCMCRGVRLFYASWSTRSYSEPRAFRGTKQGIEQGNGQCNRETDLPGTMPVYYERYLPLLDLPRLLRLDFRTNAVGRSEYTGPVAAWHAGALHSPSPTNPADPAAPPTAP